MRLLYIGILLWLNFFPGLAYPDGQDPYRRFNEYDMQPEVWQFARGVEGSVDSRGDLNLEIPVMTVPGPDGFNFDITFSYHAPVAYHQEASWLGLGWNFSPGSITRDVQGNMKIPPNNTPYGVDFNSDENSYQYLPDFYYVTIPGKGTLTLFRTNIYGFNQPSNKTGFLAPMNRSGFYFEEHQPFKVDILLDPLYDWPDQNHLPTALDITRFIITDDKGIRYIYGLPSIAYFFDIFHSTGSIPQKYPNVWRLLAIISPDFEGDYRDVLQDDVNQLPTDTNGWIKFDYGFDTQRVFATYGIGFRRLIQNTYLQRITTPTHVAEFLSIADRRDIDLTAYPEAVAMEDSYRRLVSITLYTSAGLTVQKVKLNNGSYALGKSGTIPGKLTLRSFTYYSHTNDSIPGFEFHYQEGQSNPAWSYSSTDHYYDGLGFFNRSAVGPSIANIDTDVDDGKAWCLTQVIFPTGGSEMYFYENDRIDMPSISMNCFFDRTTSWSNDIDTTLTYLFELAQYPNQSCRRQGGIRVTRIIRTDGMEKDSLFMDFTYGAGHVPIIPPKLIPIWLGGLHLPGALTMYANTFTAMNRGTMDVHYEWIRQEYPDGSYDSSNYHIGRPTENLLYGHHLAWTYVFVTGHVDPMWGKLKSRYTRHGDFRDEKHYTYDNYMRFPVSIILNNFQGYNFAIRQSSSPVVLEEVIQKRIDDPVHQFRTVRSSDYRWRGLETRQLQRQSITTPDRLTITDYVYAHEKEPYGGHTWHPDSLTAMRAVNLLEPQAEVRVRYIDRLTSGSELYKESSITTYKTFSQKWKLHRKYGLKMLPEDIPGVFDDWQDSGGQIDDCWKLQFRVNACHFGHPVDIEDGNGNILEIYYGDNSQNLSNTAGTFRHGYVTGIRLNQNWTRKFDYETRYFRVNGVEDENGISQFFTYDEFGRLSGHQDPDLNFLKTYHYYFSRHEGGTFDPEHPNHLKTTSFYSPTSGVSDFQYFNGRADLIQTALRAGDEQKDFYSARETDFLGRDLRQYRIFQKTIAGTEPAFDSQYRRRLEDGSLLPIDSELYSENTYNALLDNRIVWEGYPGGKTSHNSQSFSYEFVSAGEELPELLGSHPDLVWEKRTTTDENGNLSVIYHDQNGKKWLQQLFRKGTAVIPEILRVHVTVGENMGSETDIAEFTVDFAQDVQWNCTTSEFTTIGSASVRFYEDGAEIPGMGCSGTCTYSGSFMAHPGKIYEMKASVFAKYGSASAMGQVTFSRFQRENVNTCFTYDAFDNMNAVYPPVYFNPPSGGNPDSYIIRYRRNTLNQLVEKSSMDQGTIRYQYDLNGNLRFKQDANQDSLGVFTYYKYDGRDRVIEEGEWPQAADFDEPSCYENTDWPLNTGGVWKIRNFYDVDFVQSGENFCRGRLGKIEQDSDSDGIPEITTRFSYDKMGRVTQKWIKIEGLSEKVIRFVYDLQGNLIQTVYPSGAVILNERNHRNLLRRIHVPLSSGGGASGSSGN